MKKLLLVITLTTLLACQNTSKQSEVFRAQIEKKKEKGIDFVAFGSSPFWYAEVDIDKNIINLFTKKDSLDFDDVTLELKNGLITGQHDGLTFTANPDSCGSDYYYSVGVRANEKQFSGCGLFLNPRYEILGKWLFTTPAAQQATIEFLNFRKFIGNDGCNQFFGHYNVTNDRIRFEAVSSTKKFCSDHLEIISKLDSVETVSFESGMLKINKSANLFELTRTTDE